MKYGDIKALFDHYPSTGHTYDLMHAAASKDGFDYQEKDNVDNRLVVNLDDLNDEALVHAAKNAPGSQVGSE